jgi:Tfp pilus assembly major pilin PilA
MTARDCHSDCFESATVTSNQVQTATAIKAAATATDGDGKIDSEGETAMPAGSDSA